MPNRRNPILAIEKMVNREGLLGGHCIEGDWFQRHSSRLKRFPVGDELFIRPDISPDISLDIRSDIRLDMSPHIIVWNSI